MSRKTNIVLVAGMALALVSVTAPALAAKPANCRNNCPAPAPSPSPTASPVSSPSPTASPVSSPSPTANPVSSPSPTASPVSSPSPTATATSSAPNTQGSWVSPEGVHLNVSTAGPFTIASVYDILRANALDLSRLAPTLTINVQDATSSYTSTSVSMSGGRYTNWAATMYLKGINSTFAAGPDDILTHEYGHAWASYWRYTAQAGSWGTFQRARWTTATGSSTLATDSLTDTSYNWSTDEIVADDYRYLFGTAAAVSERAHLNGSIPDPRNVTGLRETLLGAWRGM